MSSIDARDRAVPERRHRDAELIRRLREVGARLGKHGSAPEEAVRDISGETLAPALLRLAGVVRRMGVQLRFSPELLAALDEMVLDRAPAHRTEGAG